MTIIFNLSHLTDAGLDCFANFLEMEAMHIREQASVDARQIEAIHGALANARREMMRRAA